MKRGRARLISKGFCGCADGAGERWVWVGWLGRVLDPIHPAACMWPRKLHAQSADTGPL